MHNLQGILEEAARAGGAVLKKYFGQELVATTKKTAADLRTQADTESEAAIIAILSKTFPDANISSEERDEIDNGSNVTFVIDPLDGSNNFVIGIPYFSVAIARIEADEVTAGIVYNPVLDHLYFAMKGEGLFFNGNRGQVNGVNNLEHVTIAHVADYQTWKTRVMNGLRLVEELKLKRLLNLWSPALDFCLLATGKIEAIWCDCKAEDEFFDHTVGKFMAREGGSKVTKLNGGEDGDPRNGVFLATNGTNIHQELLKHISRFS